MTAIDNARALVARDDARLDRIRAAGFRTIGLMAPRHRELRDLVAEHDRQMAERTWEYRPGERWFDRDGVENWFVQSGVLAPGYVDKYISEGGEVIRRVVGPWETVESMPTDHTDGSSDAD